MNAEIIAVGSELLTPQRIDTNSLYLTDQLNRLGIEVVTKSVIGDDRERLAAAVRLAVSRSQVVVLTGGLGPTEDDVTREAVAAALGRPLVFRQDLMDAIEARFARMGRKMAEINRRQAYALEGAEALPNHNGTAPAQWLEHGAAAVMLLPGPPAEMKPLFERECEPRLRARMPPMVIRTRFYRVALMAESDVDQLIAPAYKRYENPVTTILAAPGDIQIHLRARCKSEDEAERLLAELGGEVEALLGDRIYTATGDPLEKVVGDLLRARGDSLSVAESCTGGMLGERITSVAGSSDYFRGGFLAYCDEMKVRMLGVSPELLREHTAVSEAAAAAMARGARERTGSTHALSVTGVAGPGGASEAAPAGTVFLGLATPEKTSAAERRFPGDRARVRAMAVQAALDLLRRAL